MIKIRRSAKSYSLSVEPRDTAIRSWASVRVNFSCATPSSDTLKMILRPGIRSSPRAVRTCCAVACGPADGASAAAAERMGMNNRSTAALIFRIAHTPTLVSFPTMYAAKTPPGQALPGRWRLSEPHPIALRAIDLPCRGGKESSALFQADAAVDDELDAGHVAALLAREIDRRPGDVPGLAAEPHRHLRVAHPPHLLDVGGAVGAREAERLLDHRRLHQSGQDRVHADAFLCVFDRGGAGEMAQRRLGGVIARIRQAGMADRRDRGDVDDRATALRFHHRDDVLHGQERALEVDGKDAVPVGLGNLHHAAELGDADVVVEHVDAAVTVPAGFDHGADLVGLGDVGAMRDRGAALSLDDAGGLLGGRRIDIDAEHARPLAGESDGRRLAVAPAGPDRSGAHRDRHFALEPIRHGMFSHRLIESYLISNAAPCALPLSPCGRGWLVASGTSNEPGEGYVSKRNPSPASRTSSARHPLPRGERASAYASPPEHSDVPLCIDRAQLDLQDLSVIVLRQAVDEHVILGPLEARDRSQAEHVQFGAFGVPDHVGDDDLAPFRVRPADHRGFAYILVLEQHFLDLPRVDVGAAGDDHVLGAVLEREIALGVERADVAG